VAVLLSPAHPTELQAATLQALAQQRDPAIADIVLAAWDQLTPELREQAFAVLASREAWVEQLLDAAESGVIAAADIPASGALALANYPNEGVRARAAQLRGGKIAADRQLVFDEYKSVLELAGDDRRGAALFEQHCTNCHQVAGRGHAIGPSLAAMANRGAEALLYNVLIPNGEIDSRYAAYTVVTVDGRVLSGIIAGESASSVTLIGPQGETTTILRIDIDELRSSGASLMPEGFEQHLDKQATADLLAYLMSAARDAEQETP
jgi:putative heme-binding domain-containing protein